MKIPIRFKSAGVVLIALIACLAIPTFVQAAAAFDQANASFAAGRYADAISEYQAVLRNDGFSAPVLFNLGNAQYRAGHFGEAVLDLERAQVLAPRDAAVAANLHLAREKAGVSAPSLNAAGRVARFVSPNGLAWTGCAALAVFCLAFGAGRWFPTVPFTRAIGGIAIAGVLAVVAAFAIRWTSFDRAIVITADAPARIAPATTAARSFVLKPGESVEVTRTYGQFVLARTPDGRSGWVSESDIGSVYANHAS
jgi:hypothetical protein